MTGTDPAPVAPIGRHAVQVARLLRAASLVLALLFVLRVLLSLGPLRSGPLTVLLRFCDAVVSQAPLAVLMVCLVGLSLLIDAQCRSSRRLARGLRAAALPVAFAYLALIPLYGTAQWWRFRAEAMTLRQGLQSSLAALHRTRRVVETSSSSAQLARAWASLPAGAPPLTRFGADVRQQRQALLRFLDEVSTILMGRMQGVEGKLGLAAARNTGLFSLACLALSVLFYRCSRLDLPSRRRWRLSAGGPPSRPGDGHRGPLDHEMKRLLRESGALSGDASERCPEDTPSERPSHRNG